MNEATRRPRIDAGTMKGTRQAGSDLAAPLARDVAPRGVLEQALRDVQRTTIGVIGSRAREVAAWLRETGRDAEPLTLNGNGTSHKTVARLARREVIVATDCVEHVANPAACLSDIKRLLSPSGRLILVAQNGMHASVRLAMLFGQYSLSDAGSAGRLFTPSDVEQLLNEAGFTVIGVERHVDGGDLTSSVDGRVPEPIVDLLSRDVDAMTSHFAFVAEPHAAAPLGVLRRRVYEMTEQQRAAVRDTHALQHRLTALETRLDHDGRSRADTKTLDAIERLDEQVRRLTERLDAAERQRQHTRDALLARIGEMKTTLARIERARYQRLILRIRATVNQQVPRGSIVAVVSRGDPDLVSFERHRGWHFPQTDKGIYAGCHPADSAEAIAHVKRLHARGARYLVIPETAFWWLDHYREFGDYLHRQHRCVLRDERTCVLFALQKTAVHKRKARGSR